jgi:hypothetical protein
VEDSGRREIEAAVVKPWGGGGAGNCGDIGRKTKSSWDFVDNSDPIITAATAAECDKSNLIQRQRNLVGGDVVLDVVCDALAEGLDGEAEQSALDRDTVPS